jgi:hypothetical protein
MNSDVSDLTEKRFGLYGRVKDWLFVIILVIWINGK